MRDAENDTHSDGERNKWYEMDINSAYEEKQLSKQAVLSKNCTSICAWQKYQSKTPSTEKKKAQQNKNSQHTFQLWGIWVKRRRHWIQTLRQALRGPWADNNLLYLHMQNPQVSLAGNLLGTAYFPHDNLSKKYPRPTLQELRRGAEPLQLSADSVFMFKMLNLPKSSKFMHACGQTRILKFGHFWETTVYSALLSDRVALPFKS